MTKPEEKRPFLTKARASVDAHCRCGHKLKLKVNNDLTTVHPCPKCGWNILVRATYGIWVFTPKDKSDEQSVEHN